MKKKILSLLIGLLIPVIIFPNNSYWTDIYNVEWNTPSKYGCADSMPFGGGNIGCNVWVENGDILLYMQKSGDFSELGECLKLGRIRIKLSPNPFINTSYFSQKLNLKDGNVIITGIGKNSDNNFKTTLKCWIDIFSSTLHIDITSDKDTKCTVRYENWRYKDKVYASDRKSIYTNSFFASGGGLAMSNDKVTKLKDNIQFSRDGVLFYHHNPQNTLCIDQSLRTIGLEQYKKNIYDCLSNRTMGGLLLLDNSIQAGCGIDTCNTIDYKWFALQNRISGKSHHILLANYTSQTSKIDEWSRKVKELADKASKNNGNVLQNEQWWRTFWNKSWIRVDRKLPKENEKNDTTFIMIRNYQLGRYLFACNYYGEYPTKFNGGNFTVEESYRTKWDPDWRMWNGFYHTSQNQRLIYWTMLKSGDATAMKPQFDLFKNAKAGGELRVKHFFGHEGLMYNENLASSGLPLPSAYDSFGDRKDHPELNKKFPDVDAGIKWKELEAGFSMEGSVKYHCLSTVEHSYMMLEYNRFTGKSIDQYIPFIKSALVFFDQHYRIRNKAITGKELDDNGKLVFYPAMAGEKYGLVRNPIDLISGIQACLYALLKLNSSQITNSDRAYFKRYLITLPDVPYFYSWNNKKIIGVSNYEKEPAVSKWGKPDEVPMLYPLFPFNRFSLCKKDEKIMNIFRNTWKYDPRIKHSAISGWQQLNIFTSRMGLVDEAFDINKIKLGCSPSKMRFSAFLGPAYDGTPDMNWLGAGMIGIQEMLLQTVGNEIRILPSWPDNIDIDFKLYAPQNTIVDVSYKNGYVTKLNVTPSSRLKDLICTKKIHITK